MGIGIALIFWAVALTVITAPVALVLLGVARGTGGRARLKRVFIWTKPKSVALSSMKADNGLKLTSAARLHGATLAA